MSTVTVSKCNRYPEDMFSIVNELVHHRHKPVFDFKGHSRE